MVVLGRNKNDNFEELDGTVEGGNDRGRQPYKINNVPDKQLFDTINQVVKDRQKMDRENAKVRVKMAPKEPDIDHRNVMVYDTKREINGEFDCVNIHIEPQTPICIFHPREDVFVSKALSRGEVWEEHIVKRFHKILRKHPNYCLIDLGANIGQYSLIAAKMGHDVLAVEPFNPSLWKFHKAVQKGNLTDSIKVLHNAISDKREVVYMKANVDNQGDARVHPIWFDQCDDVTCQRINTIHINDLIPHIKAKECILKLDIQGFEHKAFAKADLFLQKVSVPYIFMEWSMMREFYVTDVHESEDKTLVENMIELLTDNDYTVYSLVSGKKLNTAYWHGWPEDVLWIQEEKVSREDEL